MLLWYLYFLLISYRYNQFFSFFDFFLPLLWLPRSSATGVAIQCNRLQLWLTADVLTLRLLTQATIFLPFEQIYGSDTFRGWEWKITLYSFSFLFRCYFLGNKFIFLMPKNRNRLPYMKEVKMMPWRRSVIHSRRAERRATAVESL